LRKPPLKLGEAAAIGDPIETLIFIRKILQIIV